MRVSNRELLNEQLRPVFEKWDGTELVDMLAAAGLACANVNDVAAILDHPQLHDRGFFSEWTVGGHNVKAPGAPWRMMGNAGQPDDRLPAVTPGQHAESVLQDWVGADSATVDRLRADGALG
jgi:crotonobetainyl-CoA:carnitine CoA-transferase CaiB-like acyl-CoA transferase